MIERMEQGENWLDAWSELGFHDPFVNWILANGAARDRVADAFADLRGYLDGGDAASLEFKVCVWNIVLVLLGAQLVAVIVFTLFNWLMAAVRVSL